MVRCGSPWSLLLFLVLEIRQQKENKGKSRKGRNNSFSQIVIFHLENPKAWTGTGIMINTQKPNAFQYDGNMQNLIQEKSAIYNSNNKKYLQK